MTDTPTITKAELLSRLEKGWNDFQAYIDTLSEQQLIEPKDAAGWTAKDHIMHLAVWEDGIDALLNMQPRYERMGLDKATFDSGDYDYENAVIQQQHKDKSLTDVIDTFKSVHQRLVATLESLTDEDLMRPYKYYQPEYKTERPVIAWIIGNTFEHYAEHTPWIADIVKDS